MQSGLPTFYPPPGDADADDDDNNNDSNNNNNINMDNNEKDNKSNDVTSLASCIFFSSSETLKSSPPLLVQVRSKPRRKRTENTASSFPQPASPFITDLEVPIAANYLVGPLTHSSSILTLGKLLPDFNQILAPFLLKGLGFEPQYILAAFQLGLQCEARQAEEKLLKSFSPVWICGCGGGGW